MIEVSPDELAAGAIVYAQAPLRCRVWRKEPKALGGKSMLHLDDFVPLIDVLNAPLGETPNYPPTKLHIRACRLPFVHAIYRDDIDPIRLVIDVREVQLFTQ